MRKFRFLAASDWRKYIQCIRSSPTIISKHPITYFFSSSQFLFVFVHYTGMKDVWYLNTSKYQMMVRLESFLIHWPIRSARMENAKTMHRMTRELPLFRECQGISFDMHLSILTFCTRFSRVVIWLNLKNCHGPNANHQLTRPVKICPDEYAQANRCTHAHSHNDGVLFYRYHIADVNVIVHCVDGTGGRCRFMCVHCLISISVWNKWSGFDVSFVN